MSPARLLALLVPIFGATAGAAAPPRSGAAPRAPAGSWASLPAEVRAARIEAARRGLPVSERLRALSEPFVGTPYLLSPLGEGAGRDPDPLLRFDAVDCLTLVEETIAMALAPDPADLVPTLNRVRYAGGEPRYEARNHVMEAQWLPNNVARGLLAPVTRRYAGAATRQAVKVLTAASWQEKGAKALALPRSAAPVGEFSLDVVPPGVAEAVLRAAPSGTLVVVVRADRPWLVTRVSHVALLVQAEAGPTLRHASRPAGRVVDEPVATYLARNLEDASWSIEGLSLYEVVAP